jgi:hypothetical protein
MPRASNGKGIEAGAVPATVTGEFPPHDATGRRADWEGGAETVIRSQETCLLWSVLRVDGSIHAIGAETPRDDRSEGGLGPIAGSRPSARCLPVPAFCV